MFISIDLRRFLKILIVLIIVVFAMVFLIKITSNEAASAFRGQNTHILVIDAGHGGIDGGAISKSGLKESDVNLSIALKTEALAQFLGIETVMTRTTDTDNSGENAYSEHNNLVARAELANSTENAILLSIHQNKFPSELVSGAEVMYSDYNGSKEFGLIMQDNLITQLDPSNRRVARPAPKELLLTSSAKCPAILVECGFMSNSDEAQRLSTDAYQSKIATVLTASYVQFISNSASA